MTDTAQNPDSDALTAKQSEIDHSADQFLDAWQRALAGVWLSGLAALPGPEDSAVQSDQK